MSVNKILSQKKLTYGHCNICGYSPKENEEMNYYPLTWYDPDDGYKTGTLCRHCAEETLELDRQPKETDYAYKKQKRQLELCRFQGMLDRMPGKH